MGAYTKRFVSGRTQATSESSGIPWFQYIEQGRIGHLVPHRVRMGLAEPSDPSVPEILDTIFVAS